VFNETFEILLVAGSRACCAACGSKVNDEILYQLRQCLLHNLLLSNCRRPPVGTAGANGEDYKPIWGE